MTIDSKMLVDGTYNLLLKRPDPREILWANFAVTYKCNSRCKMCSIWKKYNVKSENTCNELNINEINDLLKSKYLNNLRGIGLTGGEPFLRNDIVELAGIFIEKYPNSFLGIASNGLDSNLIFDKTRQIINEFNPSHLSISLSCDGIYHEHDRMRGIKNAYDALLNTISLLKKLNINIGLHFTITPQNYKHLFSVYNLSKEQNIKFLCVVAQNSSAYYDNMDTNFEWNESQLREAEDAIKMITADLIKRETPLNKLINPYSFFMNECINHQRMKRANKCFSGVHSLFLDAYGNIYPCLMLDRRIGNIRDGNFDKLWISTHAESVRNYIKEGNCSCWISCEAVPSLMRSLDVVKWNISNKFSGNYFK